MKKLTIPALIILTLLGCSVLRNHKQLSVKGFRMENRTVLYNNKPMAELKAITYSMEPSGEMLRELNFRLLHSDNEDAIDNMIYFISTQHEGDEVEVEYYVNDDNFKFKN